MEKIAKIALLSSIILLSQKCFSQIFNVKFISDTLKNLHQCDVYTTGFKNNNILVQQINLPSNRFWDLKCDSNKSVILTIDCWGVEHCPAINKSFNFNDSVIVDINKGTATFVNRK